MGKKARYKDKKKSQEISGINQASESKAGQKGTPGAPEIYSKELAERVCEEIATTSKSLKTISKMPGMPSVRTVLRWLREDKEGFCAQYARAKQEQADMMVEEMLDIADDGSNDLMTIEKGDISYEVENKEVTNRSKLRVDTRKWIASKLKPKKYGEKLDLGYRDKDGNPTDPPKQVMIINGKEIEF
jgi:hypothetical protein